MLGAWDQWYANLGSDPSAFRYGDTITYRIAADFLADMPRVEDWGCGAGGFKRFYKGEYIGVDGSKTPSASKIVDLTTYESNVEGILLRHVLEHNYAWKVILDNAVHSFTKKLCVVLFTPFVEETHEIAHNRVHGVDAPDIAFRREDIEARFEGLVFTLAEGLKTDTGYGVEHVYQVVRV